MEMCYCIPMKGVAVHNSTGHCFGTLAPFLTAEVYLKAYTYGQVDDAFLPFNYTLQIPLVALQDPQTIWSPLCLLSRTLSPCRT